jgi:monoamine oxidase
LLNAPVNEIYNRKPGEITVVALSLRGRETVTAKAAIIAIPPSLRHNITFDPELPAASGFGLGSKMGSMSKVHAIYERAFWRDDCLSGSAAGKLQTCEFVADSSSPSGKPGILTSFIAGQRNRYITDAGIDRLEVRKLVLADYEKYFGKSVWNDKDFVWRNWNTERWIDGAFTNYLKPGTWTSYGTKGGWRTPVGDIFWAGTETADKWPGYFDGAIRAGKRAAGEVLDRLEDKLK